MFEAESVKLPQDLEHRYVRINMKFEKKDWKSYNDQIMPEDTEYAKEIITFLIDLIQLICKKAKPEKMKPYVAFLGDFYWRFYYGPNGDDSNYLDFDETVNGKAVYDIFTEIWQMQNEPTKAKLLKIKEQFLRLLKEFD